MKIIPLLLIASLASGATVPITAPLSHLGDTWPTPLRTIWVDRCGRGNAGTCGSVTCSDSNTGTDKNAPLCTIGKGADVAVPGDLIQVRAGTSPADGYWERDSFRGKTGLATMKPTIKGTAICVGGSHPGWGCTSDATCGGGGTCDYRPIVMQAYATDAQPVHIDPSGHHTNDPAFGSVGQCWTQGNPNFGRYAGISFGGIGSCNAPPATDGIRNEQFQCYGGSSEGKPCAGVGDCPGGVSCDRRPWYWIIDGFHFTNWNFYDARLNINSGEGSTTGNYCSEKAVQVNEAFGAGCGAVVGVTIQNNEFTKNGGGGVLWAVSSGGNRWFHNSVHDNYTRGYTTAMNHWMAEDSSHNRKSYFWGNRSYNNYDDPPPWAHAGVTGHKICRPTSPTAPPSFTCVSGPTPGAACQEETDCGWGHCGGICKYDPYYGAGPVGQGYNCECKTEWKYCTAGYVNSGCNDNGNCGPGGVCGGTIPQTMCDTGLSCIQQINNGGGGEPSGNTEGRGLIIDRGGTKSAVDIRNNVFSENAGDCISIFLSDGGNATLGMGAFSNNTCYHNAKKGASFAEGNITARFLDSFNNLYVPRQFATCKAGPNGAQVCFNPGSQDQSKCDTGQRSYGCSVPGYFQYDNVSQYATANPTSVKTGWDLYWYLVPGNLTNPFGFEYSPGGGTEQRNKTFADYLAYGIASGLNRGTSNLIADPLLLSTTFGDPTYLQPAANSPAKARGNTLYAPTFDINGVTRPNPPGLGAIEPHATITVTTTTGIATTTTTSTSSTTTTTGTPVSTTTTTTLPGAPINVPIALGGDANCPNTLAGHTLTDDHDQNFLWGNMTCSTGTNPAGYDVNSISVYMGVVKANTRLDCGIYSDANPHVKVCESNGAIRATGGDLAPNYLTMPLLAPCHLPPSRRFWIACNTNDIANSYGITPGLPNVEHSINTIFASPLLPSWNPTVTSVAFADSYFTVVATGVTTTTTTVPTTTTTTGTGPTTTTTSTTTTTTTSTTTTTTTTTSTVTFPLPTSSTLPSPTTSTTLFACHFDGMLLLQGNFTFPTTTTLP